MLSFVFLSDGPCTEKSWHVNDDKNQWWSRRDALARIVACSLWSSPGHWNGVVGDASLLFHVKDSETEVIGQGSDDYSNPVVVHCGKELLKRLPVPTERNLLKLWKEAFNKAEDARLELCVGGASLGNGILCNNEPWKEQLLMNRSSPGPAATIDPSELDKRELLVLLQKNCNVEFLRKHGLNGSEALILKKKNRDSVLKAFTDWSSGSSSSPVSGNLSAENTAQSSTSYCRLVATCTILLGGILQRATGESPAVGADSKQFPTGYLLFLHEDYPDELNVFTPNKPSTEQHLRPAPIVCAMGAVRDALDIEVSALIAAATSLGMRVVGANLGRTAEFTSKIVTALVHHALAGVLNVAVTALPAVNSPRTGEPVPSNMGVIHKLAPVRKGGWTWDGRSNKSTIDRKRKYSPDLDADATLDTGGVKVTQQHRGSQEEHNQRQCCMHIAAWLPIVPAEVTVEMTQRERLHGLIQLVVTSLWRSRIASEAASDIAQDAQEDCGDGAAKVLPVLYLIFADGAVARLTQRRLAVAMANQHMAAPSEYQILQMIVQLLQQPDVQVHSPESPGAKDRSGSTWTEVLPLILPVGLHKSERKAVRVVAITDTASVYYTGGSSLLPAGPLGGSVPDPQQADSSICKNAYADHCSCGGADSDGSSDRVGSGSLRQHVVVLLNCPLVGTMEPLHASLFRYVYPDRSLPSSEEKMGKKVGSMVFHGPLQTARRAKNGTPQSFAPSGVVTVLQHFAYHDRLCPAIEQAIAEATSS